MRSYRLALSIAGLGLVIAGVIIFFGIRHQAKKSASVPLADSSVSQKKKFTVPKAPAIYQISEAAEERPKIVSAEINPTDVHVGDTQTFKVVLEDEAKITSVVAKIQTDHTTQTVELAGDQKTYSGTWRVVDTHDTTYRTTFTAKDDQNRENSVTLAWSDACSIPNSGDWSLSSNGGGCSLSSVDGVDNGNATINSNLTLTLNSGATFAWNSGKSITITGGGKIALGSGAQLKQTYLWKQDADGDTYPGATQVAQDTQPAGYVRRYTWTGSDDCNDQNANAYPGETTFYSSPVTIAPDYDYNCDSMNEQQYPSLGWSCSGYADQTSCNNAYPTGRPPAGWNSDTSVPACGSSGLWQDSVFGGCAWTLGACGKSGAVYSSRTQSCR